MTFKDYVTEDKIDKELKAGLQSWVDDYKKAKKAGNEKLAKELKANIEKKVEKNLIDVQKFWSKVNK